MLKTLLFSFTTLIHTREQPNMTIQTCTSLSSVCIPSLIQMLFVSNPITATPSAIMGWWGQAPGRGGTTDTWIQVSNLIPSSYSASNAVSITANDALFTNVAPNVNNKILVIFWNADVTTSINGMSAGVISMFFSLSLFKLYLTL